MTQPFAADDWLLRLARWVCIGLRALLWLVLVALILTIPFLFLAGAEEFAGIQRDLETAGIPISGRLAFGMVVGLLAALVAIFERFLATAQQLIASLGTGDPFIESNAIRVQRMGWLLLASQGVALLASLWSVAVEPMAEKLSVDGDLSPEALIAALGLFILARVFRHGAAMRDDLEGTV